MDIQLHSIRSTTVSDLQTGYRNIGDLYKMVQVLTLSLLKKEVSHLRSISLGFLLCTCSSISSNRSVLMMSVQYSSFPCRATVSNEAKYTLFLALNSCRLSRVRMNWRTSIKTNKKMEKTMSPFYRNISRSLSLSPSLYIYMNIYMNIYIK